MGITALLFGVHERQLFRFVLHRVSHTFNAHLQRTLPQGPLRCCIYGKAWIWNMKLVTYSE